MDIYLSRPFFFFFFQMCSLPQVIPLISLWARLPDRQADGQTEGWGEPSSTPMITMTFLLFQASLIDPS